MFRTARLAAAASLLFAGAAQAAPQTYVTMRDGAEIAVSVHPPDSFDPALRYPAILEMSGYDGGSAQGRTMLGDAADALWKPATGESFEEPVETGFAVLSDSRQLTESFGDDYVVVHASIRGTGCSGGEFDIYSLQSALDGWEVVEWMADQSWSNGDVAIFGHSYSGMTGFMIAATRPPSLRALSVSGLIEDVYRGILYPGGVSNFGFPLFWSAAIRPGSDVIGGTVPGLLRPPGLRDDPDRAARCGENFATRPADPSTHPVLRAGSSEFDGPWFRSTALISYLNGDLFDLPEPFAHPPAGDDPRDEIAFGIEVPIHVTAAYQDEQTGGRGPTALWERVGSVCRDDGSGVACTEVPVPKRLLLTNGDHNTQNPKFSGPLVLDDRRAWLDHWMGLSDEGFGTLAAPQVSTTVLLEKRKEGSGHAPPIGGRIDAACGAGGDPTNEDEPCFPLPDTTWTDLFLQPDGALAGTVPAAADASQSFFAGPAARQGWFYAAWSAGLDVGPPLTTMPGPDELTFRTASFERATTIAGPVVARLWAASTNTDGAQFGGGDLFVQLLDEGPDGDLGYLQRGMLRMRHQPIPPPDDPLSERAVESDVRDAASVTAVVDGLFAKHGRLDYLFNNAGIGVGGEVLENTLDDWRYIVDVNLMGVVHGIQAAYPRMVAQGFGHIVNTASMAGLMVTPMTTSYGTTKAAVVGLSRALRVEAAEHGVRVSVLCPGVIRTPILTGGRHGRIKIEVPLEKQMEQWERMRPMDPARFADEVLDQLARNREIVIVPSWWKIVWWVNRLSPGLFSRFAARAYRDTKAKLEAERRRPT